MAYLKSEIDKLEFEELEKVLTGLKQFENKTDKLDVCKLAPD